MTDNSRDAVHRELRATASSRLALADVLLDRILHDLKQPLNLARAVAQDVRLDVFKDRLDVQSLPQSMADIEQAVDELVHRIEQLRIFLKPPAPDDKRQAADLDAACNDAIARLKKSRPTARISADISQELPRVRGKTAALAHAVWELLENGARAAEEAETGAVAMHLSAKRSENEILLTVNDNGCGIGAERRSRIFEPFYTTRSVAAGLGLTLAAALLRDAGGEIGLATSCEDGSSFVVALRVFAAEQVPDECAQERS